MTYIKMPIMGATLLFDIPFAMLIPHEDQAVKNHYQSLEKLAARGGLGAAEALSILEDRPFGVTGTLLETEQKLVEKVRRWRTGE